MTRLVFVGWLSVRNPFRQQRRQLVPSALHASREGRTNPFRREDCATRGRKSSRARSSPPQTSSAVGSLVRSSPWTVHPRPGHVLGKPGAGSGAKSCNAASSVGESGLMMVAGGSLTKSGAGPTDAALVVAARGAKRGRRRRCSGATPEWRSAWRTGCCRATRTWTTWFRTASSRRCSGSARCRIHRPSRPGWGRSSFAWSASACAGGACSPASASACPESIDPDALASPTAPGEVAVELRRVYALVSHLPAEQRVALILRRVDGLEIPQIAEQMGLSMSTVKRRLKAAEELLEQSRRP